MADADKLAEALVRGHDRLAEDMLAFCREQAQHERESRPPESDWEKTRSQGAAEAYEVVAERLEATLGRSRRERVSGETKIDPA